MYELMVEGWFSAAHFLRNYKGKCEKLHGHNWKVQAFIRVAELKKSGIGIDFKILKSYLNNILNEFDHTLINEHRFFKKLSPSSENLAYYIFDRLVQKLNSSQVIIHCVSVWESNTSSATYFVKE